MKIIIDENNENIRLDKVLSNAFNISRSKISKGEIYVNNKVVKPSYISKLNDNVELILESEKEVLVIKNNIDIKVVYEDDYLAVINKPYNLVVHPSQSFTGDTLVGALINRFERLSNIDNLRNGIVHRLDKDTSGLMIIAKDNDTHLKLQEMFKSHNLEKEYLAILKGNFKYDKIKVETYIGRDKKNRKQMSCNTNNGKIAISTFEKLSSNNNMSLVKINIKTGRTHQIRVHSKHLGYPVLGDSLYTKNPIEKRQQLHSYYLKFNHPVDNKLIELTCDIPKDMKKNIDKYELGDYIC